MHPASDIAARYRAIAFYLFFSTVESVLCYLFAGAKDGALYKWLLGAAYQRMIR